MTVEAIHHVQLAMPRGQEDAARVFYSGLLGIPEQPKPPNLALRGGVWFHDGNLRIHLGVDPDFRPAKKAHAGLLVRDLDGLVRRMKAANVEVTEADELPGFRRVYVADPFGNRLELMEPDARQAG